MLQISDLFFVYLFLPICLVLYYALRKPVYRNAVLIVFSLIFYAWGDTYWALFLLPACAAVNFVTGRLLGKYKEGAAAKLTLAFAVIFNIGMLLVYKYTGFFIENLNTVTGADLTVPEMAMPLGISFFSFSAISYNLDCFWDKIKPERNYFNFLMYLSLFAKIIAGPIVRYEHIQSEISVRRASVEDISTGITRIVRGLAKKLIIADGLNSVVKTCFGTASEGYSGISHLSVTGTLFGCIMVSLWYYFDFSGYSDIAIGIGRLFGFHFKENFLFPFISRNITEFWQRWHISLGTFFRDYLLYVPLFGKRLPYVSLFIVWFSTGLWHGASWNYICWGLYYGLFILLEIKIGKKRMKKIPAVLTHIYSKAVIFIGFGIFYFESMPKLGTFFKSLVGLNGNGFVDDISRTSFLNNIYLVLAAVILSLPIGELVKKIAGENRARMTAVRTAGIAFNAILLVAASLMMVSSTSAPFLYARF
ncbi:MAG: MBOAT family O-acyltransferase [Oscillospiraceae bacterium]